MMFPCLGLPYIPYWIAALLLRSLTLKNLAINFQLVEKTGNKPLLLPAWAIPSQQQGSAQRTSTTPGLNFACKKLRMSLV